MRTQIVLAAVAAAALAAPAHAVLTTDCVARVVDGVTPATAYCSTSGPAPMGNRNVGVLHTITVEVAGGAVDVTFRCDQLGIRTHHVSGPQPVSFGYWAGYSCVLTLAATESGTIAVAWAHGGYAIIVDAA